MDYRNGLLNGRHQGSELNKLTEAVIIERLGNFGPAEPLTTERGKVISISIAKAVCLENGRPSISQMQKLGRKKKAVTRQGARVRRPTARARRSRQPSPVSAPAPAPTQRPNARNAAQKATAAMHEQIAAMPIPPQRRRKQQWVYLVLRTLAI